MISFPLLLVFFAEIKWFDHPTSPHTPTPPDRLLIIKFCNLTVSYILNIQAYKYFLVLYLKVFVTSQLELEMVEWY